MTLLPRRTGVINSQLIYNRRHAKAILNVPIAENLAQTDQLLVLRNGQYSYEEFFTTAVPQPTLTWISSNSIQVEFGSVITNIGGRRVALVSFPITKQLTVAWAPGNNSGGLFSGTAANTTYHMFVIFNPITGAVDAGFDTSVLAANRPVGWLAKRVGSIIRRGNNILKFFQLGHYFELDVRVADLQDVYVPTTPTLYALTVPTGLPVIAHMNINAGAASLTANLLVLGIQSAGATSMTLSGGSTFSDFSGSISSDSYELPGPDFSFNTSVGEFRVGTNTSGQIQLKRSGAYHTAGTTIQTLGWEDYKLYCG